jgi:hypothetical protein
MNFVGSAIPMQVGDIDKTAHDIGVEPAVLRAVLSVETGGFGFDKSKRPKALFERHYFYKFLKDKPHELQLAVNVGLAYPKWGERPYPKGSDAVYAEIEAAYEIYPSGALLSVSWGLGQIMGNNYKLAGCSSVEEMVEQAKESEANQLKQIANFIKSAGLLDELQRKDWAAFARGYNGPQYAVNKYDQKLETAYQKYA